MNFKRMYDGAACSLLATTVLQARGCRLSVKCLRGTHSAVLLEETFAAFI
jgi:hypothetical protein